MTHAERLALIYRPFFIRYVPRSYLWSGTIIGDAFPRGNEGQELLRHEDWPTHMTVTRVFEGESK